jgi:SPP1 gp7 family putative phage head morphogenesis protein
MAEPLRRETRRQRAVWQRVRAAGERYYRAQLRKIAQQVGHVASGFDPEDATQVAALVATLQRYAAVLAPWARAVAARMLAETARRDRRAWRRHARLLGEAIEAELNSAPIGGAYQDLMARQVDLITSIPLDAAKRVHELATAALYEGRRAGEIAAEIRRQADVSRSKAELIAVTEVGRAATTFQRVRAQALGSEGFIWRAVMDYKTRPEIGSPDFARLNTLERGSHRKLDGTFHRWDEPPIAGTRGERALPGCIYRCRCICEPVLPASYTA